MNKRQRKKKPKYKGVKGRLRAENNRLHVMQLASHVQICMLKAQIGMIQAQRVPPPRAKGGEVVGVCTGDNTVTPELIKDFNWMYMSPLGRLFEKYKTEVKNGKS